MRTINRSALLPYSDRQVFALVNDIESYPLYMDGCVGAQVMRSEENLVEARLDLARAGISQSFCTRNRLQPHSVIELELVEGPFRSFSGRWDFTALGDMACKVTLQLEFMVSNALLGAAAGKLFDSVTNNLVDALAKRAKEVYG